MKTQIPAEKKKVANKIARQHGFGRATYMHEGDKVKGHTFGVETKDGLWFPGATGFRFPSKTYVKGKARVNYWYVPAECGIPRAMLGL